MMTMASTSRAIVSLIFDPSSSSSSSSCSYSQIPTVFSHFSKISGSVTPNLIYGVKYSFTKTNATVSSSFTKQICKATSEYKFPDPIPEFADSETEKFRSYLLKKLSKKHVFEDSLAEVIEICTEIFSTFLHTEYGGSGTLLVVPFIDMADTINERGLPGGPQAARAAVNWARDHVDNDWDEWTGADSS